MKKILFICFLFSAFTFGQWEIRGGMGITYSSTPKLYDYLNSNYAGSSQLGNFSALINFSAEASYYPVKTTAIGLELNYVYNSFTYGISFGQYDLSYDMIDPSLYYYYVIPGEGYSFKFGAGGGLRFLSVNEKISYQQNNYSSIGVGIGIRADGNTKIGESLYANIGLDLKYDIIPAPKSGGTKLFNNSYDEEVNFNSLSMGVRLGITYFF